MKLLTGAQLGQALCEALGIPTNDVVGISINCEPGRAAEVLVRYVVSDEMSGRLKNAVGHYILIKANNGADS